MKGSEISSTDADHFACLVGEIVVRGPSMEEICNSFAFLTLENYVDQPSVVFGVSESDVGARSLTLSIEVAKAEFQTDEEKVPPVLEMFAVLVYRRAAFV